MSTTKEDTFAIEVKAKEQIMLERILDSAKAFYQDPENQKAFEAWKKNKEDPKNADHINIGPDKEKS